MTELLLLSWGLLLFFLSFILKNILIASLPASTYIYIPFLEFFMSLEMLPHLRVLIRNERKIKTFFLINTVF